MLPSKNAETTLYAELIHRGLPADYARRTAQELDDHRADLLADLRQANTTDPDAIADERLGETRQLAKKIARDYRRRSWFGRWRLVSSLLLAPMGFFAAWLAVSFVVAVGVGAAEHLLEASAQVDDGIWRDATNAWRLWLGVAVFSSFLLPVLFMWRSGRLLLERAQSRVALVIACLAVALLNGCLFHHTSPCPDNPALACNGFGLVVGPISEFDSVLSLVAPIHLGRVLIVLATGAALLLRDAQLRRRALLAPSPSAPAGRMAA